MDDCGERRNAHNEPRGYLRMKVGIVTIGNELISGKTQDTNSSFIARLMTVQGWRVPVTISIPDDEGAIRVALSYCMSMSDAVVVTGGLGPTLDDITTAAIAGLLALLSIPMSPSWQISRRDLKIFTLNGQITTQNRPSFRKVWRP